MGLSAYGILCCHTAAFLAGFILDLLIGDPHGLPHPVALIGRLISALERGLYKKTHPVLRGGVLVFFTVIASAGLFGGLLVIAYIIHPVCGALLESVMTWQILATRSLKTESMKVYSSLSSKAAEDERLEAGRKAVSMIVGRDTEVLDERGVIRAAVETVAENASDGVIAPMLCLTLGGPILGFIYKSVNTMDSMIGYKNDRYLYFGRAAAKLDDAANYIPSRLSAAFMIGAAYVGGGDFDGKNAARVYRRDRRNHASPNSAQTEAVCAGALGIRLAGDAVYFGKKVSKPFIGDADREVEIKDIIRANRLMYTAAFLCMAVCMVILCTAVIFTGIRFGWTFR